MTPKPNLTYADMPRFEELIHRAIPLMRANGVSDNIIAVTLLLQNPQERRLDLTAATEAMHELSLTSGKDIDQLTVDFQNEVIGVFQSYEIPADWMARHQKSVAAVSAYLKKDKIVALSEAFLTAKPKKLYPILRGVISNYVQAQGMPMPFVDFEAQDVAAHSDGNYSSLQTATLLNKIHEVNFPKDSRDGYNMGHKVAIPAKKFLRAPDAKRALSELLLTTVHEAGHGATVQGCDNGTFGPENRQLLRTVSCLGQLMHTLMDEILPGSFGGSKLYSESPIEKDAQYAEALFKKLGVISACNAQYESFVTQMQIRARLGNLSRKRPGWPKF